ncbi:hypothetical protein B0A48_02787 [Cryoendolithus antarcticus]|uniref:Zn(2)-C6 fungal-type domain-containing protein n=1 Tax=Cryoendolithus antarcticus TaxID=1507870 RepID=A0A1V8TL99_9PEZI|nr:hypothetical protein B0A48_02787 [Cryoendolithus antarcticus]
MSTTHPQTMADPAGARRRAACDECRSKKLKCTGEQPACMRCVREGVTCLYSPQKAMGRPRKRQRSQPLETNTRINATGSSRAFDNADHGSGLVTLDNNMRPTSVPVAASQFDSTTWLSQTIPTPPDSLPDLSLASSNSCACLSSLYLSLSSLASLPSNSLLQALPALATALASAQSALLCPHCPTRLITNVQNTQVLSTLLTSLASAFMELLAKVDDRAARVAACSSASYNCADASRHDRSNEDSRRMAAKLPIFALVWGTLCPSCQNPHNLPSYSSDGTSYPPTLMSLVHGLKNRQDRFHAVCAEVGGPYVDARAPGEREHLCQKMAGVAGIMVEGFDWS